MAILIDSSLWIDLSRARSPRTLKAFIAPYVNDPQACVAEPIVFEVLRHATEAEKLIRHFETMPMLTSPAVLWGRAADLGRTCRRAGVTAGSLDLVIAAIALHHAAELVTFDAGFKEIGRISGLPVTLLKRPKA
jgi:predicted nucleic acid-binding protein